MQAISSKKKILILCFTDTRFDARVARQIDFLKDNYQVTFVGHGSHLESGIEFIEIPKPPLKLQNKAILAALLISRNFNEAYWYQYPYKSLRKQIKPQDFDVIIANDIESLPLAFFLGKDSRAKIIFDAHEYAPRHFEDRLYWRIFFQKFNLHFCRKYIPQVNGMLTVCDGLAREYHKHFFVMPEVLTNAPEYHELSPSKVEPDRIKLIHHGIVNISRKFENMIGMMELLDERFSLDIMVKATPSSSKKTLAYFDGLKRQAERSKNVQFIPAVTSREVVSSINKYDMGLFLVEPINFNYTYVLPNKLFDFIQARLGVAISPSIEMKKIVNPHHLGVVGDDFSAQSLAAKLNKLKQEDVIQFKENSHRAARQLSAEKNKELLNRMVESVLSV